MKTLEQKARDILERMDIEDAQSMTAGDVLELANLLNRLNAAEAVCEAVKDYWDTPGEHLPIEIERKLDIWRKVKDG